MSTVQLLRVSGCGGAVPASAPLQHRRQLDRAAATWAEGGSVMSAAERTGYRAQLTTGLRVSGSDDAILQALRRSQCRELAGQSLRDVGVYHRGTQTWLVMAAPEETARAIELGIAPRAARISAATRVLQLVNEVRAKGTRCGDQALAPAPPLQLSGILEGVAAQHAADMARHDYFEHVDLKGNTPADRVRAAGYPEKLVGENIAYGPTSAQEVVAGWLHSSGHCQNIMDPRFVEMGLAMTPGHGSRHGWYWDQVLSEPAN